MTVKKNMTLVALQTHIGEYAPGSKRISFHVPAAYYAAGPDRMFSIPMDLIETRANPARSGTAARLIYADSSFCYANNIQRILKNPISRDGWHRTRGD